MSAKPSPPSKFDAALLSLLACPACGAELRLEADHLVCAGCRRSYPITEGIPVLIAGRAELEELDGSDTPPA